ncbi:DUF2231 domain-containing protein [Crocosphaera sp. UHCC 0190]|uniref:DUF2231 domain-containing protein n=1 Tax=Crocosphaera sp. UHCC 0190 TaxID=3110246 RepID=UPI002B20AEE9|nr:DUF2231 domain-containing protein [Crocosphaera sp. UHCC 0190]MEA5508738.1 DUF2231 domain-containing protein [Crocosphaera sp. UHCC 0190]
MFNLLLNSRNLPYPDPLHPIIVHFVIAMIFFSFFCDVVGYVTGNIKMFEVSFWNLFVASVSIFLAIIAGQFEAGLSQPYEAVKPVLNLHTIIGWSLAGFVATITAWRFVIRIHHFKKIPPAYLGVATVLIILVSFQVYLGTRLVWVYGLHIEPVVQAAKEGILQ